MLELPQGGVYSTGKPSQVKDHHQTCPQPWVLTLYCWFDQCAMYGSKFGQHFYHFNMAFVFGLRGSFPFRKKHTLLFARTIVAVCECQYFSSCMYDASKQKGWKLSFWSKSEGSRMVKDIWTEDHLTLWSSLACAHACVSARYEVRPSPHHTLCMCSPPENSTRQRAVWKQ